MSENKADTCQCGHSRGAHKRAPGGAYHGSNLGSCLCGVFMMHPDIRDLSSALAAAEKERDEARRIHQAREAEVSKLCNVLGIAFDVVNERRAKIGHARETANMCRLAKAVDGYIAPDNSARDLISANVAALTEDLAKWKGIAETLRKEQDAWKRRAVAHGCDAEKGDADCG